MKLSKTQESVVSAIYAGGGEIYRIPGTRYFSSQRDGLPILINNGRWGTPEKPASLSLGTVIPLREKGVLKDLKGKAGNSKWSLQLRLTALGEEEARKLAKFLHGTPIPTAELRKITVERDEFLTLLKAFVAMHTPAVEWTDEEEKTVAPFREDHFTTSETVQAIAEAARAAIRPTGK